MLEILADPVSLSTPDASPSSDSWQQSLKTLVTTSKDLLAHVGLSHLPDSPLVDQATQAFPVRVPLPYLQRIEKGNPQDPLLLQVLAQSQEMTSGEGYTDDPVGDQHAQAAAGIVHKYHGRVLLITTGSCAINCRYCFRRSFPYSDHRLSQSQWLESLHYIAERPDISEVILSGGDPLVLNDDRLAWLISQIEAIAHVKRLRIHTRLPIVIPNRVTDALVARLTQSRLKVVVVLHINHPQEIDDAVAEAAHKLAPAVTLLNQSVLLKHINNCADVLCKLSERLFEIGILPYYLHLLDKVKGAQHFDLRKSDAILLHQSMQAKLPGYLVPKLVQEIPKKASKTLIIT